MACELGQHQYCAPDDGMWRRNSCRGHERVVVAACDPKRSIRPFAEPPTRRWDLASRARGELAAGVIDHEEHVQRSERDRSDAEEVARPDLRAVLPQERPPSGGRPATMGSSHILG